MSRHAKRYQSTAPTIRQQKVAEEIRQTLSMIVSRGHSSLIGLQGISVTVTAVRVSADLKHAYIYIIPLGGHKCKTVVEYLNRFSSFLRTEVARKIRLRVAPQLHFESDLTFDCMMDLRKSLSDPHVAQDIDNSNIADTI